MSFWNKQQQQPGLETSEAEVLPARTPPPSPKHKEPFSMATMKREELPTNLGGSSDLLLGSGAEFEGKLTFKGQVRIDAKFTGTIITDDVLVVGEHARIAADIHCGTIIVHGEVTGNIKAKTAVELHQPAKVRGNIETASLMIEKGVILQGDLKMDNLESIGSSARNLPAPAPAMVAVK
jgi:cytoskeletal protein CcmA (bactofilin family)